MKHKIIFLSILTILTLSVQAQDGHIVNIKIHAVSIEKNLVEESPDLSVAVYLPPGYDTQLKKRYPVVYWLHGFGGTKNTGDTGWDKDLTNTVSKLISSGSIKPLIIVMPDGSNRFGGSMYTNSITTGNWEDFIADELPNYIDTNYRTLSKPASRGIAGHSMGGYGAIKIAMKHPDIFSVVYGTSPCCLAQSPTDFNQKVIDATLETKSWEEWENADFYTKAILAQSAAYAPNPANPPFYGDLPYKLKSDTTDVSEKAKAKWLANIPSWMADQYNSNLKQLRAIAFDAGSHDIPKILRDSKYFAQTLTSIKVQNTFEVFDGGHVDKVNERIETKILPFFSKELLSDH